MLVQVENDIDVGLNNAFSSGSMLMLIPIQFDFEHFGYSYLSLCMGKRCHCSWFALVESNKKRKTTKELLRRLCVHCALLCWYSTVSVQLCTNDTENEAIICNMYITRADRIWKSSSHYSYHIPHPWCPHLLTRCDRQKKKNSRLCDCMCVVSVIP